MDTGCSILMNIGPALKESTHGMGSTICWSIELSGQQVVDYALEGVIVSCGATIEWLKNSLELFAESRETEALATPFPRTAVCMLFRPLVVLVSPTGDGPQSVHIRPYVRHHESPSGTRGSGVHSLPDQGRGAGYGAGYRYSAGRTDGEWRATSNGFVLQFLADLLEKPVANQRMPDVSAQGAAFLAGLKAGIYRDLAHLDELLAGKSSILPNPDSPSVHDAYAGWLAAVQAN